MGITRSNLLIWLIIMLSGRMFCMEELPRNDQVEAPVTVPKTKPLKLGPPVLPGCTFPDLYSGNAIKKVRKEAYRSAMQDSSTIIKSLDEQRQQVLNQYLCAQEKIDQAQEKLKNVLRTTSVRDPMYTNLQDILTLLNQASAMPK